MGRLFSDYPSIYTEATKVIAIAGAGEDINQRLRDLCFNTQPGGWAELMQFAYFRTIVVAMSLLRDTDPVGSRATLWEALKISDPDQ